MPDNGKLVLKEVIESLGCIQSKYDPAFFHPVLLR